jgi:transcriptional regulator with XRE-family HTH domain
MRALGDYVRARRHSLPDSAIGQLCAAVKLSHTKWTAVEHGRGPHSKATLRKVARALGESPATLYDMAGISYDRAELATEPVDRIAQLEERVAQLEAELGAREQGSCRFAGETVTILTYNTTEARDSADGGPWRRYRPAEPPCSPFYPTL